MTLTVRLPESLESQLTRFCAAMGVSKSQVVQGALREWFDKPATDAGHAVLAFVPPLAATTSAAGWNGPYSKERLRALVQGSSVALAVHEPAGEYRVAAAKAGKSAKPAIGKKRKAKA